MIIYTVYIKGNAGNIAFHILTFQLQLVFPDTTGLSQWIALWYCRSNAKGAIIMLQKI